jgi:O-antigen/teichoic acid export membrane protein
MALDAGARGGSLANLLRHSLNYSLVPVFGKVIAVAMIPFYTDWLVREEYGSAALAELLFAGLVQLLGANLLQGMQRFYFEHTDQRDRDAVISSCTLVMAALSWVVVGALLLFSDALAPILIGTPSETVTADTLASATAIALATVPFQLSSQAGFNHLMILQRSRLYAGITLTKILLELGLRIWFVGFLGLGLIGFLLPVLIGEALATVVVTGHTLWHTGLTVRLDVLRPILRYTAPLIPVGVFQLLLHYGDQRLLEALSPGNGLDQVGVYGVAYKLGFLVTAMMLDPFVRIFHPWTFAIEDPDVRAQRVARVGTYALAALSSASLFVILFGRQALAVFVSAENGYDEAWRVVPWIAAGYVFWCAYHISQMPMYLAKRTATLAWINGGAVVVNVLCNLWLVPRYGFVGSGMATLLTFAALAAAGIGLAQREMSVPFELRRMGLLFALVVGGALATLQIDGRLPTAEWSEVALAVGIKGTIGVAALGVVWRACLSADDRRLALERLRGALRPDGAGTQPRS